MERTLVLVKPDGMKRKLMGEIISIYENRGLEIVEIKLVHPSEELVKEHYIEHVEKPFYGELIEFLTSDRVCAMILQGKQAVELVRRINGVTDHLNSDLGSIRGKYATSRADNVVHASDSLESAKREIALWFSELN